MNCKSEEILKETTMNKRKIDGLYDYHAKLKSAVSKKEYFPKALLELEEDKEIRRIHINEKGFDAAVVDRIWDIETGRQIGQPFVGYKGCIFSVFSVRTVSMSFQHRLTTRFESGV